MSTDYPHAGPDGPDLTKTTPLNAGAAGSASAPPLEVTWDDLQDPSVVAAAHRMREAQNAPLVRQVGPSPELAPTSWWRSNLASLTLAGLVGGLAGEIATEIVLQPDSTDPWYGHSSTTGNVLLSVVLSLVIGCVIVAWDAIITRDRSKLGRLLAIAAPVLLGAGLIGGFIANAIYRPMAKHVLQQALLNHSDSLDDFENYVRDHLHLPRAIAIGMIGLAIGLALGAVSKSARRTLHGALGGAVGGFLGGFVFDFIATASSTSAVLPRIVAITLTGTVIGAAIGLVEQVAREHWLEIVSGGMSGKQFILYTAETTVGSSPAAQVTLVRDPHIAPFHAGLGRRGGVLVIRPLDYNAPVLVNRAQISGEHTLVDGEVVQLGTTLLRYRAKAGNTQVPSGPIIG